VAPMVDDACDSPASAFGAEMAHAARARTGRHSASAFSGIAVAARRHCCGTRRNIGASGAPRQFVAAARAQTPQRADAAALAIIPARTCLESHTGAGCAS